ncbi:MAG: hypothetical protein NPIRA03_04640 [Nitrospirales bacterium]|nr:MAG: hypothetical protein NPIRA03_04640 [Nitrospirales bacterium]
MVRPLETVPGFNTISGVVLDLSKVPTIAGTEALDGSGGLVQIRPDHGFASRLKALQKGSLVEGAIRVTNHAPSASN